MNQETKIVMGMIGACLLIFVSVVILSNKQTSGVKSAGSETVTDISVLVREDSQKIEAPGSKVTLVEFLDFECESCHAAYPEIKRILTEYEGKITFVVRNFPLHVNSVLAAKSAEAAGEQGKFWEMYAKLFETQREWGEKRTPQTELFRKYAQEIGLDITAFNAVISGTKYEDKIMRDKSDGISAGVKGTPTFFLNGKVVRDVPNYTTLKRLIDNELNK